MMMRRIKIVCDVTFCNVKHHLHMSNVKPQYNLNSPSVRRILREMKEMQNDKSTLFKAFPLDVLKLK
jgi:hypothetical protein